MKWFKPQRRHLVARYRRLASCLRSHPDFLIIGTQKGGTTSLYHYLAQHPDILPSFDQEVHFFDGGRDPETDTFARGEAWYRRHFLPREKMRPSERTFESSPLYMFNPLVPQRIADVLPKVRLIALLRNPTERAISHYHHNRRRPGVEALSLQDALAAEEERLQPALQRLDFRDHSFIHHSYKKRGIYHVQIRRFYRRFARNRLLIVSSEDFFAQPRATLERVFRFVGVDPQFEVSDLDQHNVGSNRQAIDPGIRQELQAYFAPHNQQLYDLIGADFGW